MKIQKNNQFCEIMHPLTDEMIEGLWNACSSSMVNMVDPIDSQVIRAAADWQLKQVEKKVETKLSEWRRWSPDLYEEPCDHIENFFHYVMQELRPQENNV